MTRLLKELSLTPSDCPNIISRVFEIKFDELLEDSSKKHTIGFNLVYYSK